MNLLFNIHVDAGQVCMDLARICWIVVGFVVYLNAMDELTCGMMCELMCGIMCELMCELMCARNEWGRNE